MHLIDTPLVLMIHETMKTIFIFLLSGIVLMAGVCMVLDAHGLRNAARLMEEGGFVRRSLPAGGVIKEGDASGSTARLLRRSACLYPGAAAVPLAGDAHHGTDVRVNQAYREVPE